jgi:hypothetical protein
MEGMHASNFITQQEKLSKRSLRLSLPLLSFSARVLVLLDHGP